MPYRSMNRSPLSVTWNAASSVSLFKGDIAQSQVVNTVQDRFVIPQDAKILKVSACAAAIAGAASIQIVVGTVAPNGDSGNADNNAVDGDQVFANPVALSANIATAGQTIAPAHEDAVYPAGTLLTLRAVTGVGVTVTGLKVDIMLAYQAAGSLTSGVGPTTGVAPDVTP